MNNRNHHEARQAARSARKLLARADNRLLILECKGFDRAPEGSYKLLVYRAAVSERESLAQLNGH